jgi:membrane protease YdiL (CAAX protease family)
MTESPIGIAISLLLAVVLGSWWWNDFRALSSGGKAGTFLSGLWVFFLNGGPPDPARENSGRLEKYGETEATELSVMMPGATPGSGRFAVLGGAGAVLLVFLEMAGEHVLGISGEQKNVSGLFLVAMLSAAIVEEIVFRGYLVIEGKGKRVLLAGIVGASLGFALMHDFLWQYHEVAGAEWWEFWRGFSLNFTRKGVFSFSFVFIGSLYFYALRFHAGNREHSLLPCFAAHGAKNLAVFFIKLAEGHVVGWW